MLTDDRAKTLRAEIEISGDIQPLARLFAIFADPTRLRIITLLMKERELCVSDLARILRVSPPSISHHLRHMKDLGIVSDHRMGREVCYMLEDNPLSDYLQKALAPS